ncbi:hypothetical protein OOZ51_04985 [Arthrobacter sp. MI7-26]|nr:hypothetical protein [Arthrobacter sp. MI7-26]
MEQKPSGRKSAIEPLDAAESLAMSHAAQSAISPAKGQERPRQAPAVAVAGRVWPSQCDRCIPVVRIVSADFFVTVTETAHEPTCIHHPLENTQTLNSLSKESTTW